MRKALIATTALAFAGAMGAGPAWAADKKDAEMAEKEMVEAPPPNLAIGVGGFMQQWFGYADRSDKNGKGMAEDGGFAVQSDSEIHFKGSLESDMGLTYTVHVELQGDGGEEAIDETFVRVSGEFGQIEFGSRDHAMVRMHSGISDVGIGLTSGDTQKWIPGAYLETAGHGGTAGGGNDLKLNYISPRAAGLQVGLSYAPKNGAGTVDAPAGNDDATWGAGLNFQQAMGDMNLTFSLGHRSTGQGGMVEHMIMDGSAENSKRLTMLQYQAHKAVSDAYDDAIMNGVSQTAIDYTNLVDPDTTGNTGTTANLTDGYAGAASVSARVRASKMAMKGIDATVMTSKDDQSYTNVGFGVSFGAFGFNVAYATADMGTSYEVKDMMVPVNSDGSPVINTNHRWDHDGDGCHLATCVDDPRTTPDESATLTPGVTEVATDATTNDPRNDYYQATGVMKAASKDYDVLGVSVSYADGPMSVSLGYMTHEEDSGGEREATMVSASYTLGPGIAWKSSIFSVEDTTSAVTEKDGKPTGDMMNEGTGFVTGIALSF